MKQRARIATALSAEPDLLLLDEPTTALDVTVEAQILDLLENLRQRRGLAMLLVSHNLGIVDRICDRITVLYAGRTVETGSATDVLARPALPIREACSPHCHDPIRGASHDLYLSPAVCPTWSIPILAVTSVLAAHMPPTNANDRSNSGRSRLVITQAAIAPVPTPD